MDKAPPKRGRGGKAKGGNRTVFAPEATPTLSPRFAVTDPAGYQYLEEHGYVVFKDVATPDQVETGRGLAWDYLKTVIPDLDPKDPSTYAINWPDPYGKGILSGDGVGHSNFMWFCRGIPAVKTIYSTIWNTPQVMTSFDGFCMFRPHEYNESWQTATGWYHLDQNANNKPEKICVQGFLNFYPAGLDDGGLCVVPKSHLLFKEIGKAHFLKKQGDFCVLANNQDFWSPSGIFQKNGLSCIKICCESGDFVLWDSRTIHCSAPPRTKRALPLVGPCLPPRRLVAYICMTPQSRLTPEILEARKNAYYQGQTTSHWPEDCLTNNTRKNTKKSSYVAVTLTPEQAALVPLPELIEQ